MQHHAMERALMTEKVTNLRLFSCRWDSVTKCSTGSTELDGKDHHSSWIKTSTFKKYYCYEYLYCLYHIANIHPTHTSWNKSVKNLKVGDEMKQNEWSVQEICNGKERGVGVRALPKFFGTIARSAFLVNTRSLFLPKCRPLNERFTIPFNNFGKNSWREYCSKLTTSRPF